MNTKPFLRNYALLNYSISVWGKDDYFRHYKDIIKLLEFSSAVNLLTESISNYFHENK